MRGPAGVVCARHHKHDMADGTNRTATFIGPPAAPPGRGDGARAVAHPGLLLLGQLRQRPPERRVEEDGIVPEAAGAARGRGDHALHDALGEPRAAAGEQGDRAAEARRPPLGGTSSQRVEKPADAARVVRARGRRSAPSGRRSAVKGVHLEAGIVGENLAAGDADGRLAP